MKNKRPYKQSRHKKDRPRPAQAHTTEHRPERPKHESFASLKPTLFGFHAVSEAWLNPARRIEALYITENAATGFEEIFKKAKSKNIRRPEALLLDKALLDKMLPRDAVHQGLGLAASPLPEVGVDDLIIRANEADHFTLLMLDQVTDPHNVGAILRSASAFGCGGVIMQRRHAPDLEGVLAKTACGAVEHLAIAYETNLSRALEALKEAGFFVYGLDERGDKNVGDIKPGGKSVLVLGAEGDGMRRLVREHCDALLRLPTQGAIQSLNVSNAAAVALYAFSRRQSSH
ncbi:MAG: 23S rRNA (guanosine(2251)-2'-O)-methyltransferase RlmB [Alphaproteobacteria bacterium]